jgi:DNA-binding MarR family transcriptional regulator
MSDPTQRPYWCDDEDLARGRRVLEALRAYQAAQRAMRRRTRTAMAMGENDMFVLRFVIRAEREGHSVTAADVARHLGIATASATALVDRLENSGHLIRRPHPTDRRRILITHTAEADEQLKATLGDMHARMMAATRALTDDQAETIVAFLEQMQDAVTGDSVTHRASSTTEDVSIVEVDPAS